MKYEGVEDTVLTGAEDEDHQRKYWGPSSCHSTALHSLYAFLGVDHSKGRQWHTFSLCNLANSR